jgi:hypothetical protein
LGETFDWPNFHCTGSAFGWIIQALTLKSFQKLSACDFRRILIPCFHTLNSRPHAEIITHLSVFETDFGDCYKTDITVSIVYLNFLFETKFNVLNSLWLPMQWHVSYLLPQCSHIFNFEMRFCDHYIVSVSW